MAASRVAWFVMAALACAALPTAQAQVFDPEPHECGGLGVDSGCTFWACHGDEPFGGCEPWGCPGHWDCEQVVCDYYVETPFLLACFHDEETALLRCLTEERVV